MWRLILKLPSGNQFMGRMAIKHQVSLTGYPLSYYKKKDDKKFLYLIAAGFMFGEEKNKRRLIKDIKNQNELVNIEINGDFIIVITKQPIFTEPAYNQQIIRPNPIIINKNGHHIWDLASFEKKALINVLDFAEKYLNAKIIKFKEEKINNISFTKLLPELTKKQKDALENAINNGYYEYPKKVKMEALAKEMGISYSTYQAHLKKAEGKILPALYKGL